MQKGEVGYRDKVYQEGVGGVKPNSNEARTTAHILQAKFFAQAHNFRIYADASESA